MFPLAMLLQALPIVGSMFNRAKDSGDLAEKNTSAENLALRQQVTAEASRAPATWFDSLVDGINRLVRPLFTFGTLGLFVWACVDPISFSAAMAALQLVPPDMWLILGAVVVFWFGERMLAVSGKGGKSAAQVAEVVSQIKAIQALQPTEPVQTTTPAQQADETRRAAERPQSGVKISEEEYQREMADTSKPLSLPAIEEWNRRR